MSELGFDYIIHKFILDSEGSFVERYLDCFDEANVREPRYGDTPLHVAVREMKYEVSHVLLKKSADANARNYDDQTVLHIAAGNRDVAIVKLLLEYKVNVDPPVKYKGKTPLEIAVEQDCSTIVELLLDNGASIDNASSNLVDLAMAQCSEEVIQLILENVKDVSVINIKDAQDGKTLLHLAVERELYNVTKILLDKGACVYQVSNDGHTGLHLAVLRGNYHMTELILNYMNFQNGYDCFQCLHHAIYFRYKDIASLLLKNRAVQLEERNFEGYTPLLLAVDVNDVDLAQMCLNYGANVNAKSISDNVSALGYAVKHMNKDMVELLLRYGANVNDTIDWFDIFGGKRTVLDTALDKHSDWMVNLLLENGAVLNELSSDDLNRNSMGIKSVAQLMMENPSKCNVDNLGCIRRVKFWSDYYDDCILELEKMKSVYILGHVSFYNFLTGNNDQLAAYMRSRDLINNFSRYPQKRAFPIYADNLKKTTVRALVRKTLTEAITERLTTIFGFEMPIICTDKIVSLLSNDDIINAISAIAREEATYKYSNSVCTILKNCKKFSELF